MRKIFSIFCLIGLAELSSCGGFAGPYGYAEEVYSNCSHDTIIQRLTRVKATGKYSHPCSFSDGQDTYPSKYVFYFYSRQHNSILYTVVNTGFDKESAMLLVAVKDPRPESKWKEFNHDLDSERQKNITNWFNKEILPNLMCK